MNMSLILDGAGLFIAAVMLMYSARIILNLNAAPEEAFVVFFQHWRATTSFRIMAASFFLLAVGMTVGALGIVQHSPILDTISKLFVGIALLGILGFLRNVAIITAPE